MISPTTRGKICAVGASVLLACLLPLAPVHAATLGAHWTFDETGSDPTVFDSSGNGNNGTSVNVVKTGSGYVFNGTNSAVTVPDSPTLSPGASDFKFSVTVTTDVPGTGTDYDVLRKGLASTVGGEYKIEILNINGVAKPMCLVKDSNKHVAKIRWAPTGGLADGRQYMITCSKTATGVTLSLAASSDGATWTSYKDRSKTVSAGLGTVANDGKLFIGTKSDTGGDPFSGTIFDASVS